MNSENKKLIDQLRIVQGELDERGRSVMSRVIEDTIARITTLEAEKYEIEKQLIDAEMERNKATQRADKAEGKVKWIYGMVCVVVVGRICFERNISRS